MNKLDFLSKSLNLLERGVYLVNHAWFDDLPQNIFFTVSHHSTYSTIPDSPKNWSVKTPYIIYLYTINPIY